MALPKFQTDDQASSALQSTWAAALDPLLQNPATKGSVLSSVPLTTGANVVNHKLGRKLQGWSIVRQRSAGTVYDTQDTNPRPELSLALVASANMLVDLYVF